MKLLNAALREACATYLREADGLRLRAYDIHYADPSKVDTDKLMKEQSAGIDRLALHQVDVELLAPILMQPANLLLRRFLRLRLAEEDDDREEWEKAVDPTDTVLFEITKAMHKYVVENDFSGVDYTKLMPEIIPPVFTRNGSQQIES